MEAECQYIYAVIGVEFAMLMFAAVTIYLYAMQVKRLKARLSDRDGGDPEKAAATGGGGGTDAALEMATRGDRLPNGSGAADSAAEDVNTPAVPLKKKQQRQQSTGGAASAAASDMPRVPPKRKRSFSFGDIMQPRRAAQSPDGPSRRKLSARTTSKTSPLAVAGHPPPLPPDLTAAEGGATSSAAPGGSLPEPQQPQRQAYENVAAAAPRIPIADDIAPSVGGGCTAQQHAGFAAHNTVTLTSSIRSDDFTGMPMLSTSKVSSTQAAAAALSPSSSTAAAAPRINYTDIDLKPMPKRQASRPVVMSSQLPTVYSDVVLKTKD